MKRLSWIAGGLLSISGPCLALDKGEIKAIIEAPYPGAKITGIDKETYKGEKIYEVDFKHDGKNLEAIISLQGDLIKVDIDD